MRFQEWLLSEISWHNFPQPVSINDVLADGIDFHFEDWKKGANPQKTSALIPAVSPQPFIGNSFSAQLWDGGYINVNGERVPDVGLSHQQWVAIRKFQSMPGIEISDEQKYQKLPMFWFDFAALYLNGKKVKEQMWPRDQAQDFASMFQMDEPAAVMEPKKKLVPR